MNRRFLPATIAPLFLIAGFAGVPAAHAQPPTKPPAPAAKPGPPKPATPPAAEPAPPPPPPPFTPIETPSEIADRYHKEAMEAAAKKDWRTASKLLHKAWELKQTYDIAANLGSMAYELKDFGEAAELLDWAHANTPTGTPPEEVAGIERRLALAKTEVATVRVNANVDGCEIAVDTKVRDKKLATVPVYVAPGRHGFECTAPGYEPAREERVVEKGTLVVVNLSLRKVGDHREPGVDSRMPVWPAFLIGGLGVAGIAAGGGLFAVAASKGSSATDAIAALPGGGCTTDAAACQHIDDLRHQQQTTKNAGVWSLVGGGALLVGGVAYGIAAKIKSDAASVRVSPTAGGLLFEGVF